MKGRVLARQETHDLAMIIKDRAKVLKAHVAAQSAECLADFERQIAAVYTFDQDEVWAEAVEAANSVVKKSQEQIEKRCRELGIPKSFAPGIGLSWHGRGENALAERRNELRRVAKAQIEAMAATATVKIERESLELRTQVVAMGLLSTEAKTFLETLKPVEEVMHRLSFQDVEKKLDQEKTARRRLRFDA